MKTKTEQSITLAEDVVFPTFRLRLFLPKIEKILFENAKNAQDILDNWQKLRAIIELNSDKIAESLAKNSVLKK
jgi:hypothetical protein